MNTNVNTSTTRRGRKPNMDKVKFLYLDKETKTPRGQGKPRHGVEYLRVTVQQSVKPSSFNYGVTPFKDEQVVKIAGKVSKPKNQVSVTVIPAA